MSNDTADPGRPLTQWLHTAPIWERQRLRAFQEEFTSFLGGIQVEPLDGHALAVSGSVTAFDGLAVCIGETTPSRCIHQAGGPDEAVVLSGWTRGQGMLQARGGSEWGLAGGEAVFTRPGQLESVVAHTPAQLCAVALSRPLLASMHVDVDAALLRPLRGDPAVAMLMAYAQLLRGHGALATPALRRAAALHLHDLAALAAGAVGDAAHLARGRGVRAARLLAVKQDVEAHFTDAALSVHAVALRQGITPRYLHMLLEDEGLSFSALVLERRLALARRMLADPRLERRAIAALALDVGFGDLSYFNRSFRRRYGMTPSQARALAAAAR